MILITFVSAVIFLLGNWLVFVFAQQPIETSFCGGCLAFESRSGTTSWNAAVTACAARQYKGVSGELAIVRSEEAMQVLSTLTSGRPGALGGSDLAERGVWRWESTGEIIYRNSTRSAARFGFENFEGANEPPRLDETNRIIDVKSSAAWTAGPETSPTPRTTLCSFHPPQIENLLHTNKSFVGEQDDLFNIADFEVVPEHATQYGAFVKCLGKTRVDPNTGEEVTGRLAVLLFKNESQTVVDLLRHRSDVPFHSNETDFGVWLGGNWSKAAGSGIVKWSTGGADGRELFEVVNDGACGSFMFCDEFEPGTTGPALAQEGLMMKVNYGNAWKWAPQDPSLTMPFVCEYRFTPNFTLKAPSLSRSLCAVREAIRVTPGLETAAEALVAGMNANGTAWALPPMQVPALGVYAVKYFPEWVSFSDAQAKCASTQATNDGGDTSSGELATALNAAEAEAMRKIAVGSRVPELAPNDAADFGGAWIGLSNAATDTFSDASSLSAQLRWSQQGKLAYDSSVLWSAPAYSAAGMCQPGGACQALRLTSAAGTGHAAVTFNGKDAAWSAVSTAASNLRPFLCSYRFPLRVNVTDSLTVELYSTPMSHNAAQDFCGSRSLAVNGEGGARFRASLGYLPVAAHGRVVDFLSSSKRSVFFQQEAGAAEVYVGTKFTTKEATPTTLCLVYKQHQQQQLVWESCTAARPFLCLFQVPGSTRSVSKSHSGGGNVTDTISRGTETESNNGTHTPRESESASRSSTELRTASRTYFRTPTVPPPPPTTAPPPRTATVRVVEQTATPPAPTPKPPKTASRVAQEEVAISSSIIAIAGGGGVVAVQQQRLNLADALSSCGTGEDLGEDPGFMGSPFKWKLGADDILSYSRGMMIGNVVVICIVTGSMLLLTLIYCAATQNAVKRGLLRTRMPGAMIIPYSILLPPTAQHAVVLWANATGAGDVFYGIFGFASMVIVPFVTSLYIARELKRGRVTLYFSDREEPTTFAKKHPRVAASCIYRAFNYFTESLFEYRDTSLDDAAEDEEDAVDEEMMMDVKALLDSAGASGDDNNKNGGGGGGGGGGDDIGEPLLLPGQQQQQQVSTPAASDSMNQKNNDPASVSAPASGGEQRNSTARRRKLSEEDLKIAPSFSEGMRVRRAPIKSYKHNPDALALLVDAPFFANFGVIFEDYSHLGAPVIEIIVSTIMGIASGAAMGKTSFGVCVCLATASIITSFFHFFYSAYYRGINPRLVLFFIVSSTCITFVAVTLSFVKFLLSSLDYESAFTALGLIQGALGMMTAVMGFIGFVNFCYQLFDAFYLRTTTAQINTDGSASTATGVSKPGGLGADLLNIEEELAELERQQEAEQDRLRREEKEKEQERERERQREEEEKEQKRRAAEEEERKRLEAEEARRKKLEQEQRERDEMNRLLAEADSDGRPSRYALDDDFDAGGDPEAAALRKKLGVSRNEDLDRRQQDLTHLLDGHQTSGRNLSQHDLSLDENSLI